MKYRDILSSATRRFRALRHPGELVSGLRSLLASELAGTAESASLRHLLGQMILIRVAVLSIVLGIFSVELLHRGGLGGASTSGVFLGIGILYAVSLVNALMLRRSKRLSQFAYGQLAVDVLLATLAISITASPASILLYLLVIVAAAVTCSRAGAVVIAALAGLMYALLTAGLLPFVAPAASAPSTSDILVVYLSMVVIALVSGSLSRNLRLIVTKADAQERSLVQLNQHQRQLFDDISEGIIMLDFAETITGINSAARAILGLDALPDEKCIGRPLTEVLRAQGLGDAEQLLRVEKQPTKAGEVALRNLPNEQELVLDCTVRPLSNEQGKMLLFHDVSHVRSMEERLKLHERMTQLLAESSAPVAARPARGDEKHRITGESPVMKRVFALVERVAQSDASVLINGESGTGKELIARTIHTHGPRRTQPFVAINCAAIPESLIESELFGHKKGSFTGAVNDNPGLFRQAHGGTLFLDEIGELPLQMQTKLLRALQERTIRPVGDVRDIAVDVRVIAATHRDLKREISAHHFREDLFYRLNVVNIVVPPLRDRREDIPLLVRHFIGQLCESDRPLPQVSPEALQLLMGYPFPGNIRELENIVERALVLGGQAILPEHLPEEMIHAVRREPRAELQSRSSASETEVVILPIDLESVLSTIERDYLERALRESHGIKKHAAELLGLNFRSFRYRLKKYGMGDAGGENDSLS